MAVDAAGNVYVLERGGQRVRRMAAAAACSSGGGGYVSTLAGSGVAGYANGTGAAAQFNAPVAIVLDAAGDVVVADKGNVRVRLVTPMGNVTSLALGSLYAGSPYGPSYADYINAPTSVAVDPYGTLYVADCVARDPTVGSAVRWFQFQR